MIRAQDLIDVTLPPSTTTNPSIRSDDDLGHVGDSHEGPSTLTVELTTDHRYRSRALAVPGAYWSQARKAYAVDNPDARAASAAIALFPETVIQYPELLAI